MTELVPGQAPPPDYYAKNLGRLVEEVAARHGDLLGPEEQAFVVSWHALTHPAQRLLARILSRKGPWIRVDSLRYPEVPSTERALTELQCQRIIAETPAAPADALLKRLTVAELVGSFPTVSIGRKPAIITELLSRHSDHAIRRRLQDVYPWVALRQPQIFDRLLLLFFGSPREDLTTFILEDLGIRRFENYPVDEHTRPFSNGEEVEHYLGVWKCAQWLTETQWSSDALNAARSMLWAEAPTRSAARMRARLLNQMGALFERKREFDLALESYGRSSSHPSRERCIRLFRRLGDEARADALVREAAASPRSAAEEDFIARQLRGRGPATRPIITEHALSVDDIQAIATSSIEGFACHELALQGHRAWHLENQFPLGLAGILFWEVIFAPVTGAFAHRYQAGPRDLFWPDFADRRQQLIEQRLQVIQDPSRISDALLETVIAKRGITNRLVNWNIWDESFARDLGRVSNPESLVTLGHHVITHLERARSGFPDLLVIDAEGGCQFIEVKSPTDQLQPAQRTWLKTLSGLGLRASVRWYRQ
ncbi:MAG: VRR-NUC domain-containing protein [Pseudomonadales bacterium]